MAAPKHTNIKQTIIKAASEMLSEKSFSEISLSDIAKKSNISKGTLYYYYSNKDDILFDVASLYLDKLADDLIQWTENKQKDTSLPRLINYIFRRGVFSESGPLRLYLIGAAVSGHTEVKNKLIEKYNYFKQTIAQKLNERGVENSDYAAWLILTIMDGMLVQSQLENNSFAADTFIENTLDTFRRTN